MSDTDDVPPAYVPPAPSAPSASSALPDAPRCLVDRGVPARATSPKCGQVGCDDTCVFFTHWGNVDAVVDRAMQRWIATILWYYVWTMAVMTVSATTTYAILAMHPPVTAWAYDTANQTVLPDHDVRFSHNGLLSGPIFHEAGAAYFVVARQGLYAVSFSVNLEPNSTGDTHFALFVNDNRVPGTRQRSGASSHVRLSFADCLSVRNDGGASGGVALTNRIGGDEEVASASLSILRLGR